MLGRVQPQFTTNTTVTVYIQRERYYFYPTFTTFTFTGAIARDTARVSTVSAVFSTTEIIEMLQFCAALYKNMMQLLLQKFVGNSLDI